MEEGRQPSSAGRRGSWRRGAVQLLRLLARPARRAQGRGGIVVEPYRGYGSHSEMFLIGRAFRQVAPRREVDPDDLRAHLRDIGRRIRRRKIAGAPITVSFAGATSEVVTDADGYFRAHLTLPAPPEGEGPWHDVDLRLHTDPPIAATGKVFIPPARCRFAVVSDIDDTVMHTGVANKLAMLWRLFVADAEDRVAFPGVAALYRALHGPDRNPILYVSRAPWGIYDMLTEFFRLHAIPVGPVLFLREWGVSWRSPLPRRAEDHKHLLIEHMLALYADLPFVLIGDSGQHDPEVYARIVERHPGRIAAVYIRDVSHTAERTEEIVRLARAVSDAGSRLLLAVDSSAMARDAAEIGLITEAAPKAVAAARVAEGDDQASPPRLRVDPADGVGVGQALAAAEGERTNVVIAPVQEAASPPVVPPPRSGSDLPRQGGGGAL